MTVSKLKIFFSIIVSVFIFQSLCAQVPQGFRYQGVARDADDKVISDDFIALRIAMVRGTANGDVIYLETHQNVPTSPQGVFSLIVGSGDSNDNFQSIDWSSSSYFMRVDMDINNGVNYERMGDSQLLSVPYALQAGNAITADAVSGGGGNTDADADPTNELQTLIFSNGQLSISSGNTVVIPDETNDADADPANELQALTFSNGQLSISSGNTVVIPDETNDADTDPANEIQSLSISGSQLSISGGNTINLPVSDGTGDNWGSQIVASDGTISGDGTSVNPLSVPGDLTDDQQLSISGSLLSISGGNSVNLPSQGDDADADPTNEIQTLSKSGNNVTLSDGGGTVDISDGDNNNVNELITNFSLSGNEIRLEEGSQVFLLDLSSVSGGSSPWTPFAQGIFYDGGDVSFGNGALSDLRINSTDIKINGIEGTEMILGHNKLSFEPIGFTPSVGSAEYRRNGFEIFSGSGLETRLTEDVIEMISGDNTSHLQPDNLHFHSIGGDGFIYGNSAIRGTSFGGEVFIDGSVVSMTSADYSTNVTDIGTFTSSSTGNGIGMGIDQISLLPIIFTTGSDLEIRANDVGFNTSNPELEVHISEKDNGGNYQLFLDNDSNEWLLGAAENDNNLRFLNRGNGNFLFLDGDTFTFGAVSDKRAKKNIKDQPSILDNFLKLKVKQFEYKGSDKSTIGLIAQDVRKVFPSLISEHSVESPDYENIIQYEDGKVLGLNYTQLTFLNMKAIQEQQEIINSQKDEIKALKVAMTELKTIVDELRK